jgi:hypothetical protein
MEESPAGFTMGGGASVRSVTLREDWQALIDDAQVGQHHNARVFSEEEDAFILAARNAARKLEWRVICAKIGCNEATARKRYIKLTGRGNHGWEASQG